MSVNEVRIWDHHVEVGSRNYDLASLQKAVVKWRLAPNTPPQMILLLKSSLVLAAILLATFLLTLPLILLNSEAIRLSLAIGIGQVIVFGVLIVLARYVEYALDIRGTFGVEEILRSKDALVLRRIASQINQAIAYRRT